MKITFQTQNMHELNMAFGIQKDKSADNSVQKEAHVDLRGEERFIPMNMISGVEKGKSLIEIQQDAANQDVMVAQDYMTLMSHTMSGEDYAKMQEEGFDFSGAEPDEVVTIVDKIKAELIRSGVNIAGYTDDLQLETLKEALGNEALAKALQKSFAQVDLPLEAAEPEDIRVAWDMAKKLQPLSEGDMIYLIDNSMEPEIWNLYLAQNSGAGQNGSAMVPFFSEDVKGYFSTRGEVGAARRPGVQSVSEEMQAQIAKHLQQQGMEPDEVNLERGLWLMEKGLPITVDSMHRLEGLSRIEFLVGAEQFADAAANAVAAGKKPIHANLAETEDIYRKANRYADMYEKMNPATETDVTARRQLEEVRLRMTAEVNVKLIRSGFAIDTAPMEALIDALKVAEKEVADSLFPASDTAVEQYRLFTRTNRTVKEIPALPAQALGRFADAESILTFRALHSHGIELREKGTLTTAFVQAQEAYETLMTAPRKDMGDSIWKAFFSVDGLLQEMGAEVNDTNRKAVRILGYNRMTVDEANLSRVAEAQSKVEHLIDKMTPAAVLRMIRDGVNPLETDLDSLNTYFDSLQRDFDHEAGDYAKFLYSLEKNQDITPEERAGYIGIYRMIRGIEKADGAAVGAVVNTGAELQFANLLSAVRSSHFKGLDVKVDDALGTLEELVQKGETITDQISKAFAGSIKEILTEVSQNREAEEAYLQEQMQAIREAARAPKEAVDMLVRGNLPVNASHLLAATELTANAANPFRALRDKAQQLKATPAGLWQQVGMKEAFAAGYRRMLSDLQGKIEDYTFGEPETGETFTHMDIKELQMYHKQLSILRRVSRRSASNDREEYMIPISYGDQVTRVHLTVQSGKAEKGTVSVKWEGSSLEQLTLKMRVEGNTLYWSGEGKTPDGIMEMERIADIFIRMASENWETERDNSLTGGEISPAFRNRNRLQQRLTEMPKEQEIPEETVEDAELYRVAEMALWAIERGKYEN